MEVRPNNKVVILSNMDSNKGSTSRGRLKDVSICGSRRRAPLC